MSRLLVGEPRRGVVVVEDLAITCVDLVLDLGEFVRFDPIERFTLGKVASQFTVEVFVRPTFPRVIGFGEIDRALELLRDVRMVGEFAAVVERDRWS